MPDGSYYYLCFKDLDNSYFDADGYFSYRSGSVQVYKLDDKSRLSIDESIANMTTKEHKKIYEDSVINGHYDIYGNPIDHTDDYNISSNRIGAVILFFVITFVLGIIVPVVLLILGLVLANSQKSGKGKCWYALVASAALWILSTLLFLLLVIL